MGVFLLVMSPSVQIVLFSTNAKVPLRSDTEFPMAIGQTVMLLLWPVVWIVWAFQWRGGLSFRMLGLALVRGDGRAAGRFQCAWRALLFWLPLTGLATLSLWLDALYWAEWPSASAWLLYLSGTAWWAVWCLVLFYAVCALASPARSWHDRLAGSWLVPR